MCVCVCACVYVYVYVYVCMCVHVRACVRVTCPHATANDGTRGPSPLFSSKKGQIAEGVSSCVEIERVSSAGSLRGGPQRFAE